MRLTPILYPCGATTRMFDRLDIYCEKEEGHTDEHGSGPVIEWTTSWPNEKHTEEADASPSD